MWTNPSLKQNFLNSIADDIPQVQLLKYNYLITKNMDVARQLFGQMCDVALSNGLVIECRNIANLMKTNIESDLRFIKLRESMVIQTNNLLGQRNNYFNQQNIPELAEVTKKLGQVYFNYGDYKEAAEQFNSLSGLNQNLHSVKFQDYATTMGLCYYYMNENYNLVRFNNRVIHKNILKKMVDLCIMRDLNNIDFRRFLDEPFKNLIQNSITNLQIYGNKVMSYGDLGFIFSLLSLTYKQKNNISFVKWSAKLQNQFINGNYKYVLEQLQSEKKTKCFLPVIDKIYDYCYRLIKRRILVEIVSAFDRCPFQTIQELTGINQGQVRIFVKSKQNRDLPLIFDQITHSVVLRRNLSPLCVQVQKLHERFYDRFYAKLRDYEKAKKKTDDDGLPAMGRVSSHGMGSLYGRYR